MGILPLIHTVCALRFPPQIPQENSFRESVGDFYVFHQVLFQKLFQKFLLDSLPKFLQEKDLGMILRDVSELFFHELPQVILENSV